MPESAWEGAEVADNKRPVVNLRPPGFYTPDDVYKMVQSGQMAPGRALVHLEAFDKGQGRRLAVRGEARDDETLEVVLAELDALVGLTKVKDLVREVQAFIAIQQRRSQERLVNQPLVLHMIFKGNPGTGKTTVARIFGKLFRQLGVLPKGHLVEIERADIVGEYIGHTAQKTREHINKALGGILFIDEAYSLARGGEKDFGKEAIDTLVKAMEDHKDELILILAGYQREMESFLQANTGLRSRFPIQIDFPDYSVSELLEIADLMLSQREYRMAPEATGGLRDYLSRTQEVGERRGNARKVRNIIERAIRRHAVRLADRPSVSREQLMLITGADIEEACEE